MMKFYGSLAEYSKQLAKELSEKIASISVKEAKGEGTFEMIATTEGIDRDGEVILVSAWDFTNFMKNPVVLLSHDYRTLPIGAVNEIIPQPEERNVKVRGIFANTAAGQEARKLYEDGILRAMSVGFIAKEREGNVITKAELLEISFVSVPANPDALSLSKLYKFEKLIEEGKESITESQEKASKNTLDAKLLKFEKLIDDMSSIYQNYSEELKISKSEVEEKSGRVLSSKNLALVNAAIDALSALKNATEPEKGQLEETTKELLVDAQSIQKLLEAVIKNAKAVKETV